MPFPLGEGALVSPAIGDVASAAEVGRSGRAVFRWSACPGCGTERWIIRRDSDRRCKSCAATEQLSWDGGRSTLGDTVSGSTLGKATRAIYVRTACPDCGKERWVIRRYATKRCQSCATVARKLIGDQNPRWKGGVRQGEDGYRYMTVYEDHPFIEMASKVFVHGKCRYCIAEHRLVMAQHLGRPLLPWELVHHLNDPKDDNRIENLELLKFKKEHLPSMSVQRLVKSLQSRVTLLEAEVALLRAQFGRG